MKMDMEEEQEIPQGISITVDAAGLFTVKGPKGEVKRKLFTPRIKAHVSGNKVIFESKNATQREKKMMKSYLAHIRCMFNGVQHGHVYKLKVCASHFPMTANVKGSLFEVKNFIGESVPRTMPVPVGVNVKVDGQIIVVDGIDKELVGRTAARIEQITRRPGFDKRIFQDGIYLIEKDGKPLKA
ncbi:MAG: 50S ribosomal protein L6 [archaeon]